MVHILCRFVPTKRKCENSRIQRFFRSSPPLLLPPPVVVVDYKCVTIAKQHVLVHLSLNKRFYFSPDEKFGICSFASVPPRLRTSTKPNCYQFEWNRSHSLFVCEKFLTLIFGLLQVIGYSKTWQNLSRLCHSSDEIGDEYARTYTQTERKKAAEM